MIDGSTRRKLGSQRLTLFMMKSPDFLGDEERYIAPLM
ncbi:hypothetical protein PA03_04775 [Cutibacterium acnes P03]|jgi:hypothetical protein|nr:hypothetical protein TIB1ST10_10005 [Cutibacterium acnes 6609]ESS78554.1 hypothetical protein H497_10514 [Cutibacterium acnes PA2]MCM4177602.1 hypothetical protein [Cutibacterium acnes P03]